MAPLRCNLISSFPWIVPGWGWGRNPRKGRDQILPSGNTVHLEGGLVSQVLDDPFHPLSVCLHGLAPCDWRLAGEQVHGLAVEGGVGGAVLRALGPALAGLAGVEEGGGGLHFGVRDWRWRE